MITLANARRSSLLEFWEVEVNISQAFMFMFSVVMLRSYHMNVS